jgi:hypothetical protein
VGYPGGSPEAFLIEVFRQDESVVMAKLEQQASDRGRNLRQLLDILNATVPGFVAVISAATSRK